MSSETFHFELILADGDEIVDDVTGERLLEMSNAVYEAGCDDCTPGYSCGVVDLMFSREAGSLREAIESAIADVERAGYRVAEVRPEDHRVYQELNQRLAQSS